MPKLRLKKIPAARVLYMLRLTGNRVLKKWIMVGFGRGASLDAFNLLLNYLLEGDTGSDTKK